jgi:hypothetical protein
MSADYTLVRVDHDPFADAPLQDPGAWAELEKAAAARGMTVQQHLTDLMNQVGQRQRLLAAPSQGTA